MHYVCIGIARSLDIQGHESLFVVLESYGIVGMPGEIRCGLNRVGTIEFVRDIMERCMLCNFLFFSRILKLYVTE